MHSSSESWSADRRQHKGRVVSDNIDFRDLMAFRAVAETLSFTRAAEITLLPQSSLSNRVRRLERTLLVDLFHRTTRQVALSESGRRLLDHMCRLESVLADAIADVVDGARRIVVCSSMPEMSPVISDTCTRFPELRIEHVIGETEAALPKLVSGEYHLLQGYESASSPLTFPKSVRVAIIAHEPLWIILANSHPLAESRHISIRDLHNEGWIEEPQERFELRRLCARAGFTPDIRFRGPISQLLEHIRAGRAVSLIHAHAPQPPGCVIRPLVPEARRTLFLAWHVDTPEDVVRFQLDRLRSRYRRLAEANPAFHELVRNEPERFPGLLAE